MSAPVNTGLAVHIGLNNVDPNAYGGWDGSLDGSENDARSMAAITRGLGYKRRVLLSADATAGAVLGAIRTAGATLTWGDILVITYAGHGGQFDDLTGEESDRKDETWLLYNRELLDDEILAALGSFRAGVRVVVISDSCHSGSVVRDFNRQLFTASQSSRSAYAHVAPSQRSRTRGRALPDTTLRMRSAPPTVQAQVLAEHGDTYRRIRAATAFRPTADAAASVLLLAACQDNQVSLEYGGHGVFTAALLDRWADGAFAGDYSDLLTRVRSDLPSTQSPNYLAVGRSWTAFEQQHPFTLTAPLDGTGNIIPNEPGKPTSTPPFASSQPPNPPTLSVTISVSGDLADFDPSMRRAFVAAVQSVDTAAPADDPEIKIDIE